ncbi:MAG: hypothetical protein ABI131_00770, partial [Nostocoides sp.]
MGEHVDAVAVLTRGARPSRKRSAEHDFLAPSPPTPAIARPTVWTASQQSVEEVLGVVEALEVDASSRKELLRRVRGVEVVLAWLRQSPGESWQQRWLASGADTAGRAWSDLIDYGDTSPHPGTRRALATGAAGRLILAEVIRPSYAWLYDYHSTALYPRFEQWRDPTGFAAMAARCDTNQRLRVADRRDAFVQLARILIHNGGALADITVADCVEAYRAQTAYSAHAHSYWFTLLRDEAILPRDAPQTLHAASRRGQLSVEEIVDGYGIVCRPLRDLFVDYLRERQPGLDYSTIRALASKLILLFWRDLELHEPGINSLHLSDQTTRAWKQRLTYVHYGNHKRGQERQDRYAILMAVRAFYTDLSHWALEDPARWGAWAARSPVDSRDLAGLTKATKQRQARMHQRTRELAPLLPRLVDAANTRRVQTTTVLAAATRTEPGALFTVDGQRLRRTALTTDPELGGGGRPGVVYATDAAGQASRRNLTLEADNAFWAWACVEVFRHTGARIEEMLE